MTRSRLVSGLIASIAASLILAGCGTDVGQPTPSDVSASSSVQDEDLGAEVVEESNSEDLNSVLENALDVAGPRMIGLVATTSLDSRRDSDTYLTAALIGHLGIMEMTRSVFEASDRGDRIGLQCDSHAVLLNSERVIDEYLESWIEDANSIQGQADLVIEDWAAMKAASEAVKTKCVRWDSRECQYRTSGALISNYARVNDQLTGDGYASNLNSAVAALNKLNSAREEADALGAIELSCDPQGDVPLEPGLIASCEDQPINTFDFKIDTGVEDESAEYFLNAYANDLGLAAVNTASAYCELSIQRNQ